MKLNNSITLWIPFCLLSATFVSCNANNDMKTPIVKTSSGSLRGASIPLIRYAKPPVGELRWEPPQPFYADNDVEVTAFGPSCVQQFPFDTQNITLPLLNNPPPPESEDCLYLNVWTPADTTSSKPVMFWIHGGGLTSGTGSTPAYDGTNLAKNHDVIVVTINYRTNVFGFPQGQELFPDNINVGFMDQDMALQWVKDNIVAFGGNNNQITIAGESAGSQSVANMLQRHAENPPFRAAIMESGAATTQPTSPNFSPWDAMAPAVGCNQSAGDVRLACLKATPTSVIRNWTNGPSGIGFAPLVDNTTFFSNPIVRIKQNKTARVPIIIGSNQDEGSLIRFLLESTGITSEQLLNASFPGVTVDEFRALYPGQNDSQLIESIIRETIFLCPAELTATEYAQSGITDTFRYTYGPIFEDLQLFPRANAWHSSEIQEVFGTFNASTASSDEITLSNTMQTMWANFIKDPTSPPVPNWPRVVPESSVASVARLAYKGNVNLDNVVEPVPGYFSDGPCGALWNKFLVIQD